MKNNENQKRKYCVLKTKTKIKLEYDIKNIIKVLRNKFIQIKKLTQCLA
ncbi:hypothetical protein SAMN06295967_12014 [Belliella buryatensis]|uniref:Uncharacterized protein n=1 Tax=Belliella buryatensis TaxID=1500549 RepID=A0A239GWH5_9BACT|nr:hypothetical protein SAMN06295967_12014 [Belliella buryatensis]